MNHKNIIQFIGLTENGPLCILTDYAKYGNLFEVVHNEKLSREIKWMEIKIKDNGWYK